MVPRRPLYAMDVCVAFRLPSGATCFVWRASPPEVGSIFVHGEKQYEVRAVHGRERPVVQLAALETDVAGHALDTGRRRVTDAFRPLRG
jgi:hypothetical protein